MLRLILTKSNIGLFEGLSRASCTSLAHATRLLGSDARSAETPSKSPETPITDEKSLERSELAKSEAESTLAQTGESLSDDITVPWYLREDIKSSLLDEKEVKLPEVPPHAPEHVSEFLELLAKDYGMENLLLFDMTTLEESHEFKANNRNVDFIIISTGKSERHILKAATEFRTHIKHKFDVLPSTEGMVSSAKTPAMRRKLLRRARKGPSSTDNEYGRAANSWVLFHHDNVDVHILTAERRLDLNLESLWCPPEDAHLYEQKPAPYVESDHIFSGIRHFHTTAERRSTATVNAATHSLQRALSQSIESDLQGVKSTIDAEFSGSSLEQFRARYKAYKAVHLTDSKAVSFEDVECTLLEKYASLSVEGDWASEKINDVTEYSKLLLDSPATRINSKEAADFALDKLSQFISLLYSFSSDRFSMSENPDFMPILWRMTYWENGDVISPKDVDQFIETGLVTKKPATPLITLASNDARNVLTLIEHHNKTAGEKSAISPSFLELVFFTYGNAGKWKEFWAEWDKIFFPQTPIPSAALQQWVRLVSYLLMISSLAQNLHFFDYYWKTGSAVGGTLMECLEANGRKFSSPNEKRALLVAVNAMADSLDPSKEVFVEVRKQLAAIESVD